MMLRQACCAFCVVVLVSVTPIAAAENITLSQEALADSVKPSVVRIAEHVSGTARIAAIKVDIKQHVVAEIPDTYTDVPVDEYLSGSGFIIHPDGYIATNAHVVSQETVKRSLASESALSAMFSDALFLSDQEMQDFIGSDDGGRFRKEVLQYVIDHSIFNLSSDVVVLRPNASETKISDLIAQGFPAQVVTLNDQFADDERDVAIIKIDASGLPAIALDSSDGLAVGKKAFIMGFPATAEVNQNDPVEATFTQGVVSAIKQSSDKSFSIFQTDAKVSEGSSGGPLFNDQGEVVGIITFQTDQIDRVAGDNFAFALPIGLVRQAADAARILPEQGQYGIIFRTGFEQLSKKHCVKAISIFSSLSDMGGDFSAGHSLGRYIGECQDLIDSGKSLDTRFDEVRAEVDDLKSPAAYLIGAGLIVFGVLSMAVFWLLRQVKREEREIAVLERRLNSDERRIRACVAPVSVNASKKRII